MARTNILPLPSSYQQATRQVLVEVPELAWEAGMPAVWFQLALQLGDVPADLLIAEALRSLRELGLDPEVPSGAIGGPVDELHFEVSRGKSLGIPADWELVHALPLTGVKMPMPMIVMNSGDLVLEMRRLRSSGR